MGLEIRHDRFAPAEYVRFGERLTECLQALEMLLERPGFGAGPSSIGAELEVALIDATARPLPLNVEVLQETVDPRMTVELDRFNLECNLRHGPLAGAPFAALRAELDAAHAELSRAAAVYGGRVAMIGILPTVRTADLGPPAMTDTPRYRALARALRDARDGPFRLDISGDDPLRMDCEDVTFEGAATSLQLHLRVTPGDFATVFNAVQLATAPALALAGNSPFFLGHRLWEETRVALFKQAVDSRDSEDRQRGRPARVAFGTRWLREGALELFDEAVARFDPLLPVVDDEAPLDCLAAGRTPTLHEMRLHQGTVWSWNRPVYDPADGGHLRIELRALPSGPSVDDMLANAAFAIGLTHGLAPEIGALCRRLDFGEAHANFYAAARHGLAATLAWPDGAAGVSAPGDRIRADALGLRLLDVAQRGLRGQGVAPADSDPLLDVIAARLESGQTGAVWQRRAFVQLAATRPRHEVLAALVERYVEHSSAGAAVHRWPLPVGE